LPGEEPLPADVVPAAGAVTEVAGN